MGLKITGERYWMLCMLYLRSLGDARLHSFWKRQRKINWNRKCERKKICNVHIKKVLKEKTNKKEGKIHVKSESIVRVIEYFEKTEYTEINTKKQRNDWLDEG